MKTIKTELRKYADRDKAKILQGFFKTGRGQYGEGDVFLGVSVPDTRRVAKSFVGISLDCVASLLKSEIHEERLAGLLILVEMYKKADEKGRKEVFDFYFRNVAGVNNWDLVDLSAPNIVGDYLVRGGDRKILYKLVKGNLWERRIAIVSTFAFIREGEFDDTLKISKVLLGDSEDLIHKAVGWMLREVGKRDEILLKKFLRDNYDELPRTTLRYAIERFGEGERKRWLGG